MVCSLLVKHVIHVLDSDIERASNICDVTIVFFGRKPKPRAEIAKEQRCFHNNFIDFHGKASDAGYGYHFVIMISKGTLCASLSFWYNNVGNNIQTPLEHLTTKTTRPASRQSFCSSQFKHIQLPISMQSFHIRYGAHTPIPGRSLRTEIRSPETKRQYSFKNQQETSCNAIKVVTKTPFTRYYFNELAFVNWIMTHNYWIGRDFRRNRLGKITYPCYMFPYVTDEAESFEYLTDVDDFSSESATTLERDELVSLEVGYFSQLPERPESSGPFEYLFGELPGESGCNLDLNPSNPNLSKQVLPPKAPRVKKETDCYACAMKDLIARYWGDNDLANLIPNHAAELRRMAGFGFRKKEFTFGQNEDSNEYCEQLLTGFAASTRYISNSPHRPYHKIDLTKYQTTYSSEQSTLPLRYRLPSIISHSSKAVHSGHYIATIKGADIDIPTTDKSEGVQKQPQIWCFSDDVRENWMRAPHKFLQNPLTPRYSPQKFKKLEALVSETLEALGEGKVYGFPLYLVSVFALLVTLFSSFAIKSMNLKFS
ncbi:uncharacterized protein BDR25DRAFT_363736 [Lindgomyces ingoldianus]|uniref:Uncharacterized protein n=1 Tax=Lindgomyces ingoldianus TaxID=673940 RepID=A0ACB6Q6V3_9PLEO|nr:uncharacterized protein BDR25DRAFT_363736 [Lindgomyces ingoldianus]KAF2462674.1 hypothetical protein BDR25DRAFT_363736 [Lindgomyces ingoldianus]